MSQEPALFATSIKENILLGRPDASLVEIEEAARVANAHSFVVKLTDGYDTQVTHLTVLLFQLMFSKNMFFETDVSLLYILQSRLLVVSLR